MNKKELIEQEVQKTLLCFDEEARLAADPYFYTRLKTKMNQEQTIGTGFSIEKVVNMVMKPSFILVLLLVNIFTAFMIYMHLEAQMDVKEQYLKTFARQYTITGSIDTFEFMEGKE